MLPVPVQGVKVVAGLLDRLEQFPVTRDQLTMLLEGNTCSVSDLKAMGITPRRFEPHELAYLKNVTITANKGPFTTGNNCYGNSS